MRKRETLGSLKIFGLSNWKYELPLPKTGSAGYVYLRKQVEFNLEHIKIEMPIRQACENE